MPEGKAFQPVGDMSSKVLQKGRVHCQPSPGVEYFWYNSTQTMETLQMFTDGDEFLLLAKCTGENPSS